MKRLGFQIVAPLFVAVACSDPASTGSAKDAANTGGGVGVDVTDGRAPENDALPPADVATGGRGGAAGAGGTAGTAGSGGAGNAGGASGGTADGGGGSPPFDSGTGGAGGGSGGAGGGGLSDGGVTDAPVLDGGGSLPPSGNPYEGARMYINPDYVAEVESSVAASPADAALFRKVQAFSTAIWLDSINKSKTLPKYLDDALVQQSAEGRPVVTTIVVYDLPNRDCAANASNGELTIENGGEARYKTEYIDPIAAELRAHAGQRIVAIVEPDSLPNLATNLSVPKCAASQAAYRNSVAYAISALAMPHVTLYVDAAHAGWLGWDDNRNKMAQIFKEVLNAAGGADKVRGFATNVANYNVLHGDDGTKLEPTNPCPDEMTFVNRLAETFAAAGLGNKHFLVDTARNGQSGVRTQWGNWCNIRGAGLGERPRVAPEARVDAFYWVKPPGESDGISDPTAPRYDAMCSSADSVSGAPQAGQWFHAYFADLVKNANPPL
jgi:cellulose 1,4-beta-cellobiosidase